MLTLSLPGSPSSAARGSEGPDADPGRQGPEVRVLNGIDGQRVARPEERSSRARSSSRSVRQDAWRGAQAVDFTREKVLWVTGKAPPSYLTFE